MSSRFHIPLPTNSSLRPPSLFNHNATKQQDGNGRYPSLFFWVRLLAPVSQDPKYHLV